MWRTGRVSILGQNWLFVDIWDHLAIFYDAVSMTAGGYAAADRQSGSPGPAGHGHARSHTIEAAPKSHFAIPEIIDWGFHASCIGLRLPAFITLLYSEAALSLEFKWAPPHLEPANGSARPRATVDACRILVGVGPLRFPYEIGPALISNLYAIREILHGPELEMRQNRRRFPPSEHRNSIC